MWIIACLLLVGCRSSLPVLQEPYATYSTEADFEVPLADLAAVTLEALPTVRKEDRERLKASSRSISIATDWIVTQSQEFYTSFAVGGSVKHENLPMRYRMDITLSSRPGGSHMAIETTEQVQSMMNDGSFGDYELKRAETALAHAVFEKLRVALLQAHHQGGHE